MELRALTIRPSRLKVRFARDRMIPGSATLQVTSGPALCSTSRVTIPPSTTTWSPTWQAKTNDVTNGYWYEEGVIGAIILENES